MRVILTLLVVIGHSAYLNMPFGFGGVDYTSTEGLGEILNTSYYFYLYQVIGVIYFFHMPAFFFLSGAVFSLNMHQNKWRNLEELVKNKARRLIYPAFIAGVFWMVPLKFIGHGYSSGNVLPYAIFKGIFLAQGTGHLWYLFTLFWIFIIAYMLVAFLNKRGRLYFIGCIFLLGTFYSAIDFNLPGGNSIVYYLLFFLCGFEFEKIRGRIFITKGSYFIIMTVVFIVACTSYRLTSTVVTTGTFLQDWLKTVGIISCTILIFILSHGLTLIKIQSNKVYRILEKHSFSLYMLHDPLNYVFLAFYIIVLNRIFFAPFVSGVILSVIRVIGSIVISIFISSVIQKIHFNEKIVQIMLASIGFASLVIIFYNSLYNISVEMTIYKP